ncbi:TPA_asm: PLP-dependent aminotransferase family protein, partial [Listeria monocytogenes]|nr:PLP-dependent aminotransferase family protein [Listeria monocytogenes]
QLLLQGHAKGEETLRQQIARYVFNSRGVSCHTSQVIIGSSTKQLINLLTDLLTHSKFIIENPSYPPIKQVLDQKHIPYEQLEVEADGIRTDHLNETHHDVVYVTPSHQFPTGYVMNLKKRTQLINWARQSEERYIIEDDYDSEFRYFGKPISALQSLDQSGKVIYM